MTGGLKAETQLNIGTKPIPIVKETKFVGLFSANSHSNNPSTTS